MKRYTPEEKEFLRKIIHDDCLSEEAAAKAYNEHFQTDSMTESKIHAYKGNNNVRPKRKVKRNVKSSVYTREQEAAIKEVYESGKSRKETTRIVNQMFQTEFTEAQITAYVKNHKIRNGQDTRYKSGVRSGCRMKKGQYAKGSEKTWFKKGHRPENALPVGSEVLHTNGYIKVKIAEPNKWKLKQLIVWEEKRGKIPDGYKIIFKDGNRQNTDIENLQLVEQAVNQYMNAKRIRSDVPEITEVAINIAKLGVLAARKEKELKKDCRK